MIIMSDSSVAKSWLHNSLPVPEWIPSKFNTVIRKVDQKRCLVISDPVRDEIYDIDPDLEEQPWSCHVLCDEDIIYISLTKLAPV
jgi:hypothetical protein